MKEKDIVKMPVGDQRILAYLKRTNYDKYIEFLANYVFPKKKHAILEHDWCCQICGGNHTEEQHRQSQKEPISDFEYWLWKNKSKATNKLFHEYLNSEV